MQSVSFRERPVAFYPLSKSAGSGRETSPTRTLESKPQLPAHLSIPDETKQMRMMHIGLGAFFKGHIASYLHDLERVPTLNSASWTLSAGNLRSDAQALAEQNGRYTLETVDPMGRRLHREIRSIKEIIRKSDNASKLVAAGAEPNVGIISCTITPAGYHYDANSKLDMTAPDVQADLGSERKTIYGVVYAILNQRHLERRGPVAILSCDNVPQNGTRFGKALLTFMLAKNNPALHRWTTENISFPNSMVDRITPKPDADLHARVRAATGRDDKAPVMTEHFRDWIIEENSGSFPAGRPDFEEVGVKMVTDVKPYEEAKVRMLNATHALLAWHGAARKKEFIHDAIADPAARAAANTFMMHGVKRSIDESPVDLVEYGKTILNRFTNPHLRDQTARVGRNGFSKISQQILPTIRKLQAQGENFDAAVIPVALHYRAAQLHFSGNHELELADSPTSKERLKQIFSSSEPLTAYCSEPKLFGDLAGHPDLEKAIRSVLKALDGNNVGAVTTSYAH